VFFSFGGKRFIFERSQDWRCAGVLALSLVVCRYRWWFAAVAGGLPLSLVVCRCRWWFAAVAGVRDLLLVY
jgi:hypothetical protein